MPVDDVGVALDALLRVLLVFPLCFMRIFGVDCVAAVDTADRPACAELEVEA